MPILSYSQLSATTIINNLTTALSGNQLGSGVVTNDSPHNARAFSGSYLSPTDIQAGIQLVFQTGALTGLSRTIEEVINNGTYTEFITSVDPAYTFNDWPTGPAVGDKFLVFASPVNFAAVRKGGGGGGIDTTGLVAGSGSIADNVAANLLLRYIADHVGGLPPSGAEILLETYLQTVNLSGFLLTGVLPSFAAFVQLGQFDVSANSLTGALPSFGTCPILQEIYLNDNGFTGIIPSFAACRDLRNFIATNNLFSGYTPTCFVNQVNLGAIDLSNNAIANDADINMILADLIQSLSVPGGRVTCTVTLTGGTNAAPTGQGLLDKIALNAAGWTVTTN